MTPILAALSAMLKTPIQVYSAAETPLHGGTLGDVRLIVDDIEPARIHEYASRLIPAYLRGLSESMDLSGMDAPPIRDMILIKFGYRFLQAYPFAASPEEQAEPLAALQSVYEMPA